MAGDGDSSEFVQLVDKVSEVFGSRVSSSVMAALRGSAGGTTKAITQALEQEAVNGDPAMSMMSALSPNLTKKLGKNPLALMALQGIVGKIMSDKNQPRSYSNNNGHNSAQAQFEL